MTSNLPKKQQQAEQRRKRAQAASGLAHGGKKPKRAVPIASRPKRPSAGLADANASSGDIHSDVEDGDIDANALALFPRDK